MRVDPNAGRILAESNIAHMVVSIFNAPMIANDGTKELGIQSDSREIKSRFVSINPLLAFGAEEPTKPPYFD